ncbi:MAG: DUF4344 domain-containing metallopeptidase [Pseudomonas sp.]|uniref:DUF4344 domain-containing metallopeptidase n=1 Tax=Pseudomonas sp. TaxID=306 RepID=UPI003BB57A6A
MGRLISGWLGVLLLGLLTPLAAADEAPQLSDEQLRFITANAEFTLLHEMGHMLINELQLPVLGREEDAADELGFIGVFLLYGPHKDQIFYSKLVDVADYWRLEWQRPKPEQENVQVWDSHSLDAQRFYNIACLAYGSDPDNLEWIIEATDLPAERAFYCDEEYTLALRSVNWLAERFRRAPGSGVQHRVQVIYERPKANLLHGMDMYHRVRKSGVLERVAAQVSEAFALPRDVSIRLTGCGLPDAWYNANSGEVTLCYERLSYFMELSTQLPTLRAQRPSG